MSLPSGFGFRWSVSGPALEQTQEVLFQHSLYRIMAFLDISIDQVCNDPIARSKVACYYKLDQDIQRGIEVSDLERQWSGPDSYYRG